MLYIEMVFHLKEKVSMQLQLAVAAFLDMYSGIELK